MVVINALRAQPPRQPVVAVAVELQAERAISGHPEVDQTERGIHEIKVVVQALAAVRANEGLVCGFVVPRSVGVTGFHRRDDVDQPRVFAALLQHALDHGFLAGVAFGDVLDRHPGTGRQRSGGVPDTITQRLREGRVIEDFDPAGVEEPGHPLRVADRRQGSRDHHTVVAGQNARYPLVIALRQ